MIRVTFLVVFLSVVAQSVVGQTPVEPIQPVVCPRGATNLCIPLDQTFSVPSMDATGGNREADPNDPCQRNNDDSTLAIPLQFTFDLYGSAFDEIYINNNGNVTFGSPFSTFTPSGFPIDDFPMIAPFWADVDTGGPSGGEGGVVYFRSEANRFTVIWDHVGYFEEHFDRTNTFQLIITDGTDPLIGIGNNVCLCWDDMQWTTGDASGGAGGFGGTPATVGANRGDGESFFLIGLFDHSGADSDGPGGENDGVDFLDGRRFCFSTLSGNIPPFFTTLPVGNKVTTTVGQEVNFVLDAVGPEADQTVTLTGEDGGLANYFCSFTPGSPGGPASARCTFIPDSSQVGNHIVSFVAIDDGSPPGTATVDICLTVESDECTMIGFDEISGVEVSAGTDFRRQYSDLNVEISGVSNSTGNMGAYAGVQGAPGAETDDLIPPSRPNYLTTASVPTPNGEASDHGVIRFDFMHATGAPRSAFYVSLTFLDIEDSGSPEGRGTSFMRGIRQDGSFVDVPVPAGTDGGQAVVELGSRTGEGEEAFIAVEAHIGDPEDSGAIDDLCFSLNSDRPLELTVDGDFPQVARGGILDLSIGLRNHEEEARRIRFVIELLVAGRPRGHVLLDVRSTIPGLFDNLVTNRFQYPLSIPTVVPNRFVGVPLTLWARAMYLDRDWVYTEDGFTFVID